MIRSAFLFQHGKRKVQFFATLFRTSIIAALMGLMFGAVAAEEGNWEVELPGHRILADEQGYNLVKDGKFSHEGNLLEGELRRLQDVERIDADGYKSDFDGEGDRVEATLDGKRVRLRKSDTNCKLPVYIAFAESLDSDKKGEQIQEAERFQELCEHVLLQKQELQDQWRFEGKSIGGQEFKRGMGDVFSWINHYGRSLLSIDTPEETEQRLARDAAEEAKGLMSKEFSFSDPRTWYRIMGRGAVIYVLLWIVWKGLWIYVASARK